MLYNVTGSCCNKDNVGLVRVVLRPRWWVKDTTVWPGSSQRARRHQGPPGELYLRRLPVKFTCLGILSLSFSRLSEKLPCFKKKKRKMFNQLLSSDVVENILTHTSFPLSYSYTYSTGLWHQWQDNGGMYCTHTRKARTIFSLSWD